jgi:O-antigen/teichoic acid export membrane protein
MVFGIQPYGLSHKYNGYRNPAKLNIHGSDFYWSRVRFAMLLVPFAQFGLSQATLKFYPSFAKEKDKSDSFLTLMVGLALLGFVIFLIIFNLLNEPITSIFSKRSPEVNNYLSLVIILTFILVIYNIITDYTRSLLKIVAPNFLREVLLRLLTTISIFLYFFKIVDFEGFLLLIVGSYFVNLLLLISYLVGRGNFKVRLNLSGVIASSELREIIKYGFFALIGASGAVIIAKVDSVMVTSLLSTYSNGIYTTAFYMAVVIEIPRRMIAQISTPLIARGLEKENYQEVGLLYNKTALNQLIIGALLFIGLWANLDSIYTFVPNNEVYVLGKWVVVIIGLAKLIDMGAGLNGEIIILSRYYKVNIIFTGALAILVVLFNLLLIPAYGITGAAIGTGFSLTIFNIIKYIFLLKKMSFQPFTSNNLKVFLIAVFVLTIALLTPKFDNALSDIVVRSILITLVYTSLIVLSRVSEDVMKIFEQLKNLIHKRQ